MKIPTFLLLFVAVVCIQLSCQQNLSKQNTTSSKVDIEKEKAAIREVVSKESDAYYKQDYETWKSTYVNEDYFREFGYWEGFNHKVNYYNGFSAKDSAKRKQFEDNKTVWQNSYIEIQNENFRIYPEIAWYTFEESTYDKVTRKLLGKCLGTRVMEKHNGQWKIAYLGYHFFPLENKKSS